jgi:type IV pilus assembly protein PilC
MPKFNFTAVDLDNKRISAQAEARDVDDLRKGLREQELVPVKIVQIDEKVNRYRLKAREVSEFSRQLSGMLGSGITVVRAVEILKNRDYKPKVRLIYDKLHRDLQMGNTLSEAMKQQQKAFPELLINMFASGEVSGQLDGVTVKMADHYEKEYRLNSKVKSAMAYPVFLLIATVIIVLFLFLVILPNFFELFGDAQLPALTQAVLSLSQFLLSSWYLVLIAAAVLAAGIIYSLRIPKVKLKIHQYLFKLPIFGKLFKIIYTARFSRTLSSLYTSGVSMLRALEISASTVGNNYINSQFTDVVMNVRNGEPLSIAIGRVFGFDRKLCDMMETGEETGRLDTMLDSVSDAFDYEAEAATLRMVQLVEPIMICLVAAIIGVVLVAVFVPLFNYSEIAAQM